MPKPSSDEYELVPYKEIEELKEELQRLKGFPIPDSKKMAVTMTDLGAKIDKLTIIFEEAAHQLKVEEGGLTFQEKMKPLLEKMNKVLEQNSEIAEGIVALADIINDLKEKMEKGFVIHETKEEPKMFEPKPLPQPFSVPQQIPEPELPPPFPGLPPPPAPKRGLF